MQDLIRIFINNLIYNQNAFEGIIRVFLSGFLLANS